MTLTQPNPNKGQPRQPDTRTWRLFTLSEFQGLLVTANGVNNATLTFHDPTGAIMDQITPQAMDEVRVRLNNRQGQWGSAWTGFVDACHGGRQLFLQFGASYASNAFCDEF